jgi:inorganic pyrophosphatase
VIAIDASDPWATLLHDVPDVEKHIPGLLGSIREWFRDYKLADGKPQNTFGLEERCMPRAYTLGIIEECHKSWLDLLTGKNERHEKAAQLKTAHRPSMVELSAAQMEQLEVAAAAAAAAGGANPQGAGAEK